MRNLIPGKTSQESTNINKQSSSTRYFEEIFFMHKHDNIIYWTICVKARLIRL